jgi:hypothetical protein
MCNGDKFEFIDKVYELSSKIKENIIEYNNINDNNMIVTLSHVKTCALMVNKEFIMKYILPESGLSYVDVALHLHDIKIKKLFHIWYVKHKMLDNLTYLNSPEYFDNKYNAHFEICNPEDLLIVITKKRDDADASNIKTDKKSSKESPKYSKTKKDKLSRKVDTFETIEDTAVSDDDDDSNLISDIKNIMNDK